MISPTLWMLIEYLLTAPLAAVLAVCSIRSRSGNRSIHALLFAGILGLCMVVSVIKGLNAVLNMFPLFIPAFCFALWCSAYFAVECVKKREHGELHAGDVIWAVGTYFGFLFLVILITPVLRWCEGCMEWH